MIKTLRQKYWQRGMLILLAIAVLVSPGIVGIAGAKVADSANILATPKTIPIISGKSAEQFDKIAMDSATNQGISKQYQLDTANLTVRDLDAVFKNDIVATYIPITDNTGENYSFYAAYFNKNDSKLLGTMAVVFNKTDDGYEGMYINNSKEVLNLSMKADGTIIKGWRIDPNGEKDSISNKAKSSSWDCFCNCLSDQGVSGYALGLLSSLCAVACADIPNPPGCIACAIAAVGCSGYIAGFCYGSCY